MMLGTFAFADSAFCDIPRVIVDHGGAGPGFRVKTHVKKRDKVEEAVELVFEQLTFQLTPTVETEIKTEVISQLQRDFVSEVALYTAAIEAVYKQIEKIFEEDDDDFLIAML